MDGMRSQTDFAMDVIKQEDATALHHANLHVAAIQIIQNLTSSGAAIMEDDPGVYTRTVHALARLSHEALNFQKYHEACTKARETLQMLRDPNRQLNDDERRAIVDKLDQILGLK